MPRSATARFGVRVVPRGGRDAIEGVASGVLRVRVAASPVDGAANTAVCRLLADALGLPVGAVAIVRGERGRDKVIEVCGPGPADLVVRWPDLGVSSPPGPGSRPGRPGAIGSVG